MSELLHSAYSESVSRQPSYLNEVKSSKELHITYSVLVNVWCQSLQWVSMGHSTYFRTLWHFTRPAAIK